LLRVDGPPEDIEHSDPSQPLVCRTVMSKGSRGPTTRRTRPDSKVFVHGIIMEKIWKESGAKIVNTASTLFDTVPKDILSLFQQEGGTDYQKVVRLLDFKKNDVARASNIAIQSVRYDHPRMPKILEDRLNEWAVALNLVAQFFGDEQRTVLWFKTPNPLLGDMTPRDMIRIGRFRKLRRFIQNALAENRSPR
jgi:uncharacterized protein (DUF2384 family)